MNLPNDYEGGVKEFYEDVNAKTREYDSDGPVLLLGKEPDFKLKSGGEDNEAAMALKYGYSQPLAQLSRLSQKLIAFMRDGNITDPLTQRAVLGALALFDLIFDSPCVNRQGRFEEEDLRITHWESHLDADTRAKEDPILQDLLRKWSAADAFISQCRVIEEMRGIGAASNHYEEYREMLAQREEAQFEAVHLTPAYYQIFWCRVRQYRIMRERARDLALGFPVEDYTAVKALLLAGRDVNELVHLLPWPFREAYYTVQGSLLDGVAHRMQLTSMYAQQVPVQQPQWGAMPPPWWSGGMSSPNEGQEGEDDEQAKPDKRKALFSFGGNGAKQEKQGPQPIQRRKERRQGRVRG